VLVLLPLPPHAAAATIVPMERMPRKARCFMRPSYSSAIRTGRGMRRSKDEGEESSRPAERTLASSPEMEVAQATMPITPGSTWSRASDLRSGCAWPRGAS
jgi:hypothetical protein